MAEGLLSNEAHRQQEHYAKIAALYIANLQYPHTQEYMIYLDEALLKAVGSRQLGTCLELCCGHGEAATLLMNRMARCIGIDVSLHMLRKAKELSPGVHAIFLQGDATRIPLAAATVDNVIMLGGVHHVTDRNGLFAEIYRVLKPGGRFYFREPLNDFLLWRGLRALIYRIAPALDQQTERPLRRAETVLAIEKAGMVPVYWRSHGLLGFCIFMNSDVLIFNRLFRFVPGIRYLVRAAAAFDEWCLSWRVTAGIGLQVVGVAEKPCQGLKSRPAA
jgi:ubiquinone/menaquinone biosynthesis C-methylase UbiE